VENRFVGKLILSSSKRIRLSLLVIASVLLPSFLTVDLSIWFFVRK